MRWEKKKETKEAPDALVLTEQEYHSRTDDPFSFATSAILWALREFSCIFIGCSMKDQLMRRSLYRSLREREAALKAEKRTEEELPERLQRHYAVFLNAKTEGERFCRENDLESLGVTPLWVSDFDRDLPDKLEALAS
jgi:hypothetical protein